MLLIACSLALLVMYAGVKLLALTQKEALGNLYKYFSWFTILMGFLLLMCVSCFAVIRCFRIHEQMMNGKQHYDGFGRDGKMGPFMMWDGHINNGEMDGFWRRREGHQERMDGECRYDGVCDGKDGECQMKKDEALKKDSIIKGNKHINK